MPEISETAHVSKSVFSGLEGTHALVQLVMAGRLSARVFVDDASSPAAGVIVYNSRILCGGNSLQPGFIQELGDWFNNDIVPAHLDAGNDAYLICYPNEGWKTSLVELFAGCKIIQGERQYYEIRDFQSADLPALPGGYSIKMVSQEFLSGKVLGLETVREEMCSERQSVDDFLEHSFGLCPIYENEVAGWCMSEYNIDDRCEIGIATLEKHQRKGLATLQTRYFLNEAYRRGYKRVGWDCWKNNTASGATARKAGLSLIEEYPAMVVVFEEKESQGEQG